MYLFSKCKNDILLCRNRTKNIYKTIYLKYVLQKNAQVLHMDIVTKINKDIYIYKYTEIY